MPTGHAVDGIVGADRRFPRPTPARPAWSCPRATKPIRSEATAGGARPPGRSRWAADPALRRYEIIVLANNCRDGTARVARRLADAHADLALHVVEIELPPTEAHVGTARRLAMDEACRRLLLVGRPARADRDDGCRHRGGADLARGDARRGGARRRGRRRPNPDRRPGAAGDGSAPARPLPPPRRLLASSTRSWRGSIRARPIPGRATSSSSARASPSPRTPTGAWAACRPCRRGKMSRSDGRCAARTSRSATARPCGSAPRRGWTGARRPAWRRCWRPGPPGQRRRPSACRARRPS